MRGVEGVRFALHISDVPKKLQLGNLVGPMVKAGFICFFSLLVKKHSNQDPGFS